MLTALQIQEMVKGGEGYNVDFKRSVPSKVKEISDAVVGFANAVGGYVFIGVDNDNQIICAEIDNNKRSAIQDTIGEISPSLKCELVGSGVPRMRELMKDAGLPEPILVPRAFLPSPS